MGMRLWSIRWIGFVAFAGAWCLGWACCLAVEPVPQVKNVIVMIPDGCGAEHYTLARWYRGRSLALDKILVGGVQTFITDSVVADSAPAATAFSTGQRSSDKVIGMGPKRATMPGEPELAPHEQLRPLATVLEGARLSGRATGIVATSRVSHATPAGYVAHVPSRSQESDIMEQLVYQGVDVVLGGGRDELLPASAQGRRADGEDLVQVLKGSGCQLPETRDELLAIKSGRVFGTFAMGPLAPEIDRPCLRPQEPTLAEMTTKAIEVLAAKPNGFFLMVEGSQIDWACHANDPSQMLSDMLAFDDAVQVALDFAKQDGQTLLLAMSDHNNGGLTIGNYRTDATYSQLQVGELLDPLRRMRRSATGIWDGLTGGPDRPVKAEAINPSDLQRAVQEHWGVDLDADDAGEILAAAAKLPTAAAHWGLGRVVSRKATVIGWSTHGHTGGDVPLFAYGPGRPVGLIDAPQIGMLSAQALEVDLPALTERLFVDARKALPGAKIAIVEPTPKNLVVEIVIGDRIAKLPVNKNVMKLDSKEIELEGVVVCAPPVAPATEPRIFVPQQAVQEILRWTSPESEAAGS